MVLNNCVEVKDSSIHQRGWFATEDIKAGTWIWKQNPEGSSTTDVKLTYEQVQALPQEARDKFLSLAYVVDNNTFLGLDPDREPIAAEQAELFVNHSCDGNCWYENDDLLVAMKDIKSGEELTYDYALTDAHAVFDTIPKCNCGAKKCRGKVSGRDWQLPELQRRYGRHFIGHVLAKIEGGAGAGAGSAGEERKGPAAANGGDDEDEGAGASSPKPKKGKKAKAPKPQAAEEDDGGEPTRRSGRERKVSVKVREALKRKSDLKEDDDDEDYEDEDDEPKPAKRGKKKAAKRRKAADSDEDY